VRSPREVLFNPALRKHFSVIGNFTVPTVTAKKTIN
jgi:hypothetical protein